MRKFSNDVRRLRFAVKRNITNSLDKFNIDIDNILEIEMAKMKYKLNKEELEKEKEILIQFMEEERKGTKINYCDENDIEEFDYENF